MAKPSQAASVARVLLEYQKLFLEHQKLVRRCTAMWQEPATTVTLKNIKLDVDGGRLARVQAELSQLIVELQSGRHAKDVSQLLNIVLDDTSGALELIVFLRDEAKDDTSKDAAVNLALALFLSVLVSLGYVGKLETEA
jgi:hypothetical protein